MVRRPKSGGVANEAGLPREYEGPEALSALLARAGSPFTAEEVAERFRVAQGAGEERSDLIPAIFPDEPRFDSPDDARRLYGNLFALWDRLRAGISLAEDAPSAPAGPAAGGGAPPPAGPGDGGGDPARLRGDHSGGEAPRGAPRARAPPAAR